MRKITILISALFMGTVSFAQTFGDLEKMKKYEGFLNFYYQEKEDRIYLVVEELDQEFLYAHSLSSGVGHNDLELDRGQLGGEAVVHFRKAGPRVLLVQSNLRYRAETDNAAEKIAVEQAFATSVLHGFPIKDEKPGQYLIDITPMLMWDMHGVSERLSDRGEGNFKVDPDRSVLELSRTKAFPDNVEFEALLTFSGKPEGRLIPSVTPDPRHVSVIQHHSFIRLPDDQYQPRVYDPRSGSIDITYMDYATPVFEPIRKQLILRHRLEKKEPGMKISEPVEPIIYYVDNGTPEPIRSALLEGGRWWAEAFESIGFRDAFRMELLPQDADPLDVRYNVVQWVHRSTRGWSYGSTVTDPRTGEIIKGHVSLGSLRIRQDFMIAQALLNKPYGAGDLDHDAMMEFALARIRQLSAHEIGHTLGFTHNFAASSNNRSSVMDYPHPMVSASGGEVIIDSAYDEGIGAWDKVTVAYAYTQFDRDEAQGLQNILADATGQGLRFISDTDARAPGGAHPYAHLWDNGASAIEELDQILEVRRLAIDHFSLDNIRTGEPYAMLEDLFVPLYLFHRYQVEAVSKLVGGVEYQYSVKGDASPPIKAVDGTLQREAMDRIMHTLSAEVLVIPREKLALFPPRPPGFGSTRESFEGRTGLTFDYLAPPSMAANLTLGFLLHPERANRLVQQKALDENLPGLEEVIGMVLEGTVMKPPAANSYDEEVRNSINFIAIDHLIRLGSDDTSAPQVKAIVHGKLSELKGWLEQAELNDPAGVYRKAYLDQITENKVRYLPTLPGIPPGAPIGMECMDH